jgi:hypothetical protein
MELSWLWNAKHFDETEPKTGIKTDIDSLNAKVDEILIELESGYLPKLCAHAVRILRHPESVNFLFIIDY